MTKSQSAVGKPRILFAVTSLILSTGFLLPVMKPSIASAATQPVPLLNSQGLINSPSRTQISYDNLRTGTHLGTANEHEARQGLSLVKLYIAEYVMTDGAVADREPALHMIRVSDDGLASKLYKKYPRSINDIAGRFGLSSTRGASHWGHSVTSTADVNKYLVAKKKSDPSSPVLKAMREASPQAADGYRQDYGTSTLPGVLGTKFGWSDDRRTAHATASFGDDFVISAHTLGTKEQHTSDVRGAFKDEVRAEPAPAVPAPAPIAPAPEVPIPPAPTIPQPPAEGKSNTIATPLGNLELPVLPDLFGGKPVLP